MRMRKKKKKNGRLKTHYLNRYRRKLDIELKWVHTWILYRNFKRFELSKKLKLSSYLGNIPSSLII